jgi:quercetin dioxygenase-like cupin family protein
MFVCESFLMSDIALAQPKQNLPQLSEIITLEKSLLELPQVDMHVEHTFANGIYARTLHVPKGAVVTGAMHRFEQINTIAKGEVHVVTTEGSAIYKAGDIFSSPAGTKRAFYAVEDTVWTTILHNPNNVTDIDILEEFYTYSCAEVDQISSQLVALLEQGE